MNRLAMNVRRGLVRLALTCLLAVGLSGCVLRLTGGFVFTEDIATFVEMRFADVSVALCRDVFEPETGQTTNECQFAIVSEDGSVFRTSTARLLSEFGLFGLLVDPVVVQVPDGASVETATVDDGSGPQDLIVTETLSFDVQPGVQVTAEPGMKFWIIDLPPAIESVLPTSPGAADLDYNFAFRIPGSPAGPTIPIKAMFTGRVESGGEVFYIPLLPCTTDFSQVPEIHVPASGDLTGFIFTLLFLLEDNPDAGCNNVSYDFTPLAAPVELVKEVSVDGGASFFDANDPGAAPVTAVGNGALYRLTVSNPGSSDLTNVVVNDAELGIVDFLVGDLAVSQTVVLTSAEIPALDQPGRCQTPGDVINVATADGQSVVDGSAVSDSDPAVLRCVQEGIELVKEVSVDGGANFFDANDPATAPVTTVGNAALYRLTVSNPGSSDLADVVVNDADLGIVDFLVGDLAVNQTVVLDAGQIPELDQPGRCQVPGDVTNVATVDGQSVLTGNTVSDSDPAVLRCGQEGIELVKEVSVDGGVTFFDANDSDFAPATPVGSGALYRLTVSNPGSSDLANVVVNDADLGIVDFAVGDLAVNQTVVLTEGEIPALDQPGRCQAPGDVTNVATVDGQSLLTGTTVSDSDPAVLRCLQDAIEIVKEVSVDGGVTFFDANDAATAPVTAVGNGALYRLTVRNSGSFDLTTVVVNDAGLGVVDFLVGDLATNQTVVLTSGQIPPLEQPGRCQDPGDVTNVATVQGQSVGTGNVLGDSDAAVLVCEDVTNLPPACHDASADPGRIWPPNHKLVPVAILGVTDPDDGDVAITVTGVTQDEPVNGIGDGNTGPDAVIQEGGVRIRAERSGAGNGRVYRIAFSAADGAGGTCSGEVTVCVPQNKKGVCVDDGRAFDALQP